MICTGRRAGDALKTHTTFWQSIEDRAGWLINAQGYRTRYHLKDYRSQMELHSVVNMIRRRK